MKLYKTVTTDDGYTYSVEITLSNSHVVHLKAEDKSDEFVHEGSWSVDKFDKYTYIKVVKDFIGIIHSDRMKMPHYDKEPFKLFEEWDGKI